MDHPKKVDHPGLVTVVTSALNDICGNGGGLCYTYSNIWAQRVLSGYMYMYLDNIFVQIIVQILSETKKNFNVCICFMLGGVYRYQDECIWCWVKKKE